MKKQNLFKKVHAEEQGALWRKRAKLRRLEDAKKERNLAAAHVRFPRQAKKLLTEWLERVDVAEHEPVNTLEDEDPNDWMRRMSYRLIRKYVQQFPAVIPDLLKGLDGRHMRGADISDNPFKQALLLFSASPAIRPSEHRTVSGERRRATILPKLISDRRRRGELADAMLYAHRHDVPSKSFNAFRNHVGPLRIRNGLVQGLREPGFSKAKA